MAVCFAHRLSFVHVNQTSPEKKQLLYNLLFLHEIPGRLEKLSVCVDRIP